MSYEQVLRAIGQGLEALDVEVFDLQVNGNNYVIRGNSSISKSAESIDPHAIRTAFLKVCKIVKSRFLAPRSSQNLSPCSELMLYFSQKDIDKLDRDGIKSRSDTPRSPKPHSLPQTLRTLGWFVDQKQGQLRQILMRVYGVKLCYAEPYGRERTEQFSSTNVYDMWVRMYKQRKGRFQIPARR